MVNVGHHQKISVATAITKGDLQTKLSIPIMGFGIFAKGQRIKGAIVFLIEIAFLLFMATFGNTALAKLPSLGGAAQEKVWNEAKQIYEYTAGDNSQLILLYGVVTCFAIAAIIVLWILQIKHSYKL